MNVIFTCGGTGGHINPAIAVANLIKEKDPNGKILFVGAKGGMEEKLVPQAGYELVGLPASSLKRKLTPKGIWQNIQGVGKILSALTQVKKIIRDFDADIVVGTGGYASFPALFMASKMGIPTCVHEANAYPGLATRLVADRVDQILVCFEESARHYKQTDKVKTVGMPVRREFIYTTRAQARAELGLDERPLIVSAFGSLGAMEMNKAMADFMKLEQEEGFPWQHIHATGKFGWKWMPDLVKEKGVDLEKANGIEMREYIYNMPTLMAAADLVISRSGSGSCNEIAASGTPCIMIPSPNVTDNHQQKNAQVLVDRGGCLMVLEKDCTGAVLYEQAKKLLADESRRAEMRKALLAWSVPDSAEQICECIYSLAQK